MPGILPMKVIKVGANAQSRIAQACDRCRSKKIRCDGVRPCCSQCANVGFECKTSDKLSRRAFPRGYTESLEERVRVLENEVRELKELLDEKDEKIDMLSRIHSQSSQPIHQLPSPRRPSTTSIESKEKEKEAAEQAEQEEVFKVQQSPYLLDSAGGADSYFAGTSSSRTFIEAFKHKVQEKGRSTAEIDTEALLKSLPPKDPTRPKSSSSSANASGASTPVVVFKAPPRLVSDQLINVFFQEWAPLFPVLHRPTFLSLYEKYVADADAVTDRAEIAQLNLVFGVAALSNGTRASDDLESFERQWRAAIDAILKESSMATLQALLLAQLFCVQKGDLTALLTYKGLATTLSARLGLHQSQKRFALGTLTCETRKKVFWTLYTVDCFTAVTLGLPKHIKDEDIQCEYPVDADDEYVSERGFQPTLPGESTKLSSALALFRAARILSKVLEEVFPAKASYELTLKKLADLSDELDSWSTSLPPHLRLHFAQDKPSTGTISSRSPLLSLTYHFIRALIQRPAICASLGSKSSSHMITLASSCKHMIQIVQLLKERGMSFSFCLNKDEVLVLSGFGLLFQGLNLDSASKILKDNQKMVFAVADMLDKSSAPCAPEFRKVAHFFFPAGSPKRQSSPKNASKDVAQLSRHNSDSAVPIAPTSSSLPASTKKQLKAIASRFTADPSKRKPTLDVPDNRRATVHNISLHPQGPPSQSTPSLQPTSLNRHEPSSVSRSEPARSPVNMFSRPSSTNVRPSAPPPQLKPKARPRHQQHHQQQQQQQQQQQAPRRLTNLDYLSFGNEPEAQPQATSHRSARPVKPEPGPTDWEKLLGSLDNGQTNIYDACYGGPAVEALLDTSGMTGAMNNPAAGGAGHNLYAHNNAAAAPSLTPDDLAWSTADLWALCQTDTNTSSASAFANSTPNLSSSGHPDSLLSFSGDEGGGGAGLTSHSSSEEFGVCNDWASVSSAGGVGGGYGDVVRGIVMPAGDFEEEGLDFGGGGAWEGTLNL